MILQVIYEPLLPKLGEKEATSLSTVKAVMSQTEENAYIWPPIMTKENHVIGFVLLCIYL